MRMVREPTQGLSKNKRLQKEFAMGGLHDSPGRSESLRLKSQGMAPLERGEPFLFRDKRENPGWAATPGSLYENIFIFV